MRPLCPVLGAPRLDDGGEEVAHFQIVEVYGLSLWLAGSKRVSTTCVLFCSLRVFLVNKYGRTVLFPGSVLPVESGEPTWHLCKAPRASSCAWGALLGCSSTLSKLSGGMWWDMEFYWLSCARTLVTRVVTASLCFGSNLFHYISFSFLSVFLSQNGGLQCFRCTRSPILKQQF